MISTVKDVNFSFQGKQDLLRKLIGWLTLQVAAQVPTRCKTECVKQFIQLPFGDNYYVEPEEPNLTLFADGMGREKSAAMVSGGEDISIIGDSKQGGTVVSRDQPAPGHATEGAAGHGLMTPFADTSHPLFAQVQTFTITLEILTENRTKVR